MRFFRCKCGNAQSWSSMGVPACTTCPKCSSTLAEGPDGHHEAKPHEFVTQYETHTGKPYEICLGCLRRKTELEKP